MLFVLGHVISRLHPVQFAHMDWTGHGEGRTEQIGSHVGIPSDIIAIYYCFYWFRFGRVSVLLFPVCVSRELVYVIFLFYTYFFTFHFLCQLLHWASHPIRWKLFITFQLDFGSALFMSGKACCAWGWFDTYLFRYVFNIGVRFKCIRLFCFSVFHFVCAPVSVAVKCCRPSVYCFERGKVTGHIELQRWHRMGGQCRRDIN